MDHGGEFWDNNDGKNYVFQCLSISKQPVSQSVATNDYSSAPIHMRRPSAPPSYNSTYSSNSSSTYSSSNRYSSGGGGGGYGGASPSVFSEDPWLRYL